jgi:hypothetical protein
VRYEQIEKLIIFAAMDEQFADDLIRAGSSARARYLLDDEEVELLVRLQRDGGGALHAILHAVRAAMDAAVLRVAQSGTLTA